MDKFDVVFLLGLLLIAVGLYFVYWPLALIVPGCVLLILGIWGAKTQNSEQNSKK